MALSANTVWEVRPTNGSDSNGGGFVAGSSGTDYSQQNAAQATGTVTSASTTVTATTGIFTSQMVGNLITDGTTWKQITAFTSSTIVTVDSAPSWTATTINVGGALKTLTKLSALMVASNKAFFKSESGLITTATVTFSQSVTPLNNAPANQLIGYTTTRTDNGQTTLTLSTNTGLTGISCTGSGWIVRNIFVNCGSLGTSAGINMSGNYCRVQNCKVSNFTKGGIVTTSSNAFTSVTDCEITGGTSAATAGALQINNYQMAYRCNVHDNVCPGIVMGSSGGQASWCLVTNNTGATSDGIQYDFGANITNCTCYGNGRHGIANSPLSYPVGVILKRNLLVSNGGYGIMFAASVGNPAIPDWDGNAYYNNTSGTRNNGDDTTTNPINGVSPYTNSLDVVITAGTPFTNAAGGDFSLNSIANQGALCQGLSETWPGNGSTTGKYFMGAVGPSAASGGLQTQRHFGGGVA